MKSYVLSYWTLMIFTKKEWKRKRERLSSIKKNIIQVDSYLHKWSFVPNPEGKYYPKKLLSHWSHETGFSCSVYSFIPYKSRSFVKTFVTLITWKWLLFSVYSLIPYKSRSFRKTIVTLITCKWPFPSVYSLMLCKSRSFGKTLVTLIT